VERRPPAELDGRAPERLHLGERSSPEAGIGAEHGEVRSGIHHLALIRMANRPRLLVLNQYYWPGVEATANLLTELCEALAATHDVTVITGAAPGLPRRAERNGVRIIRVRSTVYDRAHLPGRGMNYLSYAVGVLGRAIVTSPPDLVVCMTDPPFIGSIARLVASRFRAPLLVVMQDVFPEIAVKLGRLRNPVVVGFLRMLIDPSLRAADRVIVIGETMKKRVAAKGVSPDRIRVIPNWGDAASVVPKPHDNQWARRHKLAKRFVVMHSGNIGHAQDLDTLVRAATFLRDLDRLRIMVIGFGARHGELTRLAQRLEVTRTVQFLDYQPREQLPFSLATGDLHYVGLARGLSGYVVPSRLYGILAAGRPALVSADADSEIVRIVEEVGCGIVVPPGRPELVASVIRDVAEGRLSLVGMGDLGRAWVEREADREVAFDRYRRVVADVVASSSR
jgi:glycosyltransferase involved in cell wall biosynthesis